jgi:hypothetical protein
MLAEVSWARKLTKRRVYNTEETKNCLLFESVLGNTLSYGFTFVCFILARNF